MIVVFIKSTERQTTGVVVHVVEAVCSNQRLTLFKIKTTISFDGKRDLSRLVF